MDLSDEKVKRPLKNAFSPAAIKVNKKTHLTPDMRSPIKDLSSLNLPRHDQSFPFSCVVKSNASNRLIKKRPLFSNSQPRPKVILHKQFPNKGLLVHSSATQNTSFRLKTGLKGSIQTDRARPKSLLNNIRQSPSFQSHLNLLRVIERPICRYMGRRFLLPSRCH